MGISRPSNNDPRGSAAQRRRRKTYLLNEFGDGYTAPCAFCEFELDWHTITQDRFPILGVDGGRYVIGNIRPACLRCNSSEGAKEGARRRNQKGTPTMRKLATVAALALAISITGLTAGPALADDTAPTQEVASSPDAPQETSTPIEASPSISSTDTSSQPSAEQTTSPDPDTAVPDSSPATDASADVTSPPTAPDQSIESTTSPSSSESAKPTSDEPGSTPSASRGHDPVTICHKPGDPAQQTLTVDDNALKGHLGHGDTLGECAPLPQPVEGWWLMPNGGTADNVTWPQTATPAGVVPCGVTAQVDTYPSQAALDALAADGILTLGEDYGIAQSWRFVYGGDCPPEPGPANPGASIETSCGVATVTATNDGENLLTASIVVYVDGEFGTALAVPAGDVQTLTIDGFGEDTGTHHVVIKTGPAFGDVFLAEATVETDCEQPPVVTPPTEQPNPAPTPSEKPALLAAAPVQPVVSEGSATLAETGSNINAIQVILIVLAILALGALLMVLGRRHVATKITRKDRH